MRPLVLAVHGSAPPGAGLTLRRLCDRVERLGGVRPVIGHLDHQSPSLAEALLDRRSLSLAEAVLDRRSPSLAEALEESGREVEASVVVPLLLGDGYHRTVDIPAVVEASSGQGRGCVLAEGLRGDPGIALALRDRLCEAERRAGVRADAVVLAAAGSSRPGGNDGALVAARQLRALLPGVPVRTAYCSAAEPPVPEAVARLRGAGHRRVVVAAHLLAPGRFTVALAEAGADAVAEPIADHPAVASLVLRRYESAAAQDALALRRREPAAAQDAPALRRPGVPAPPLGAAA
ncbi:CbiX/SirB N-terminal domain-containing protein [Streptomyces sp. NPDC041068]|uniref:sirohydrochlorin chelatase n=1 Tax=Streptomyces sp. NPDC041068 TaxID=3155130 RepID=UPI0033F67BBC